jgi:hypothetical protein
MLARMLHQCFNNKKNDLCVKSKIFLGHVVCLDKLLVDLRKVTMITSMPIPLNVIEIKWFLRVVGFYKKYFWDFTNKVAPMCKLLKKDEPFNLTKTCSKTFEWMKSSMTSLLVLIILDWKLEYHVHTNASKFTLGVMFNQKRKTHWSAHKLCEPIDD